MNAVSLEGPVCPFVSQDAAGFRLMQNDIKISCSDARSRSALSHDRAASDGPALGSAHREWPSSDGMIAVADVRHLGGRSCWRGKHIRESHSLTPLHVHLINSIVLWSLLVCNFIYAAVQRFGICNIFLKELIIKRTFIIIINVYFF